MSSFKTKRSSQCYPPSAQPTHTPQIGGSYLHRYDSSFYLSLDKPNTVIPRVPSVAGVKQSLGDYTFSEEILAGNDFKIKGCAEFDGAIVLCNQEGLESNITWNGAPTLSYLTSITIDGTDVVCNYNISSAQICSLGIKCNFNPLWLLLLLLLIPIGLAILGIWYYKRRNNYGKRVENLGEITSPEAYKESVLLAREILLKGDNSKLLEELINNQLHYINDYWNDAGDVALPPDETILTSVDPTNQYVEYFRDDSAIDKPYDVTLAIIKKMHNDTALTKDQRQQLSKLYGIKLESYKECEVDGSENKEEKDNNIYTLLPNLNAKNFKRVVQLIDSTIEDTKLLNIFVHLKSLRDDKQYYDANKKNLDCLILKVSRILYRKDLEHNKDLERAT